MLYESSYYGIQPLGDSIMHHGIRGQKWGKRNGPPYPLQNSQKSKVEKSDNEPDTKFSSPDQLLSHMKSFKYADYTLLKSADQVEKDKSGSCHDQVMYEYDQLKKMGKKPKALFMMEYDEETGQGGTTHSCVYWKEHGKINYIENAWGGREGIKQFKNETELNNYFLALHAKSNEFGDNKRYPEFDIGNFTPDRHKPGETLQEFVDGIWREQSERRS